MGLRRMLGCFFDGYPSSARPTIPDIAQTAGHSATKPVTEGEMRYRKTGRRGHSFDLSVRLRKSLAELPLIENLCIASILREQGLISISGRFQRRVLTSRGQVVFERAKDKGW